MARSSTPTPLAVLFALHVAVTASGCGSVPDDISTGPSDASPPRPDAAASDGANLIDKSRMLADVQELASESFAGRAPGTPGGELALTYVETVFEDLDLDPMGDEGSFRQAFSFEQWQEVEPPTLAFGDDVFAPGTDHVAFSGSGSDEVTAEVVFAGYGLTVPPYSRDDYPDCPIAESGYDDYQGLDADGKIALILRHGPNDDEAIYHNCPAGPAAVSLPALWEFGYKAANAREHGAAAMIMVQDYRHDGEVFPGSISDSYYDATFPALVANRGAIEEQLPSLEQWATAIDEAVAAGGHATGSTATVAVEIQKVQTQTANLLGLVPGNDPELGDEIVVIGAHVDHLGTDANSGAIYTGADDNASGSAVMMELARVVRESGLEPARSILFASFNAEETGLNGSCYLARNAFFPLAKVAAMFSVDMVGAGDGSGLVLYGAEEADPDAWLLQLMERAATDSNLPYSAVPGEETTASDHACFSFAGATAVLALSQGDHLYYHTPQDTADTINPDDLQASASLLWVTLHALATGNEDEYLDRRRPSSLQQEPRRYLWPSQPSSALH